MVKRCTTIIGVALLASVTMFSSIAAAAPPLDVEPSKNNLGTITQNVPAFADVTVTNNTNGALLPGTYVLSGDTDLLGTNIGDGFTVNPNPLSGDSCVSSGSQQAGSTRGLLAGGSCTFQIVFDGLFLRSGTYTAKLNFTFGDRKSSTTFTVRLVRVP
jgi:hypothetical protein